MNYNRNNDSGGISYTASESKNIRDEILLAMPNDLSDLEKARYLYLELGKRLSYDTSYTLGNLEQKKEIYDREVTFNTLDSNNIICKSWAELYRELLVAAGFDLNRVMVVGENFSGGHKWLEIDFGDYIVRADATCPFLDNFDLSSVKYGFNTNGFIFLGKSFSGLDVRKLPDDRLAEVIRISNEEIEKIDDKIGYTTGGKYRDELIEIARKFYFGKDVVKKLFGGEQKNFNNKMEEFFNLIDQSYGNSLDIFYYVNRIKPTIFPNDKDKEKIKIFLIARPLQNGERCMTTIVCCDYNNKVVCKVIDDVLGTYTETFMNNNEFDIFIGRQQMNVRGVR